MLKESIRLAAIGDIHCGRESQGVFQNMFAQVAEEADVLLLLGDLTNFGLPDEARVLARELTVATRIPTLAVLGNHDVESGTEDELVKILTDVGVMFLDGSSREIHGVGFAGVKGFCGGFGRRALAPWGEKIIKAFVEESVNESLKLEKALAQLRNPQKVVLIHYAPIHGTVVGEPDEIVPFLGSTRLEEPLDRFRVTMAFHGHAHHGSPEGRTKTGIPIYNVAMPVVRANTGEGELPFKFVDLPLIREAKRTA